MVLLALLLEGIPYFFKRPAVGRVPLKGGEPCFWTEPLALPGPPIACRVYTSEGAVGSAFLPPASDPPACIAEIDTFDRCVPLFARLQNRNRGMWQNGPGRDYMGVRARFCHGEVVRWQPELQGFHR